MRLNSTKNSERGNSESRDSDDGNSEKRDSKRTDCEGRENPTLGLSLRKRLQSQGYRS